MTSTTLDAPQTARDETREGSFNSTIGKPTRFVDIDGTRFVCIQDMESLPTFFLTMVSAGDQWLFAATNGSLTAGRGSPETALFPYYTVDKIIDNWNSTGPQTCIQDGDTVWEPFKPHSKRLFTIKQRMFKSLNGDVLIFEEVNQTLGLSFRYSWKSSDKYGFVRTAKLVNTGEAEKALKVVDGISNFLAAGVDSRTQQEYSCLTDAYKLSELDAEHQLLVHRMAVSLTDEAIPLESLRATTVWSHGWPESRILMHTDSVQAYLEGGSLPGGHSQRAARGNFFNAGEMTLAPGASQEWSQVAEINQNQSGVAQLLQELRHPDALWAKVRADIRSGQTTLDRLIAASDGQQVSAEELVTSHHRANVLFNIMRGGVFPDGYELETKAIRAHIARHRTNLSDEESAWLDQLPTKISYPDLVGSARNLKSPELLRICSEYLPLTFSRRHGDPSRPWNRFTIQTKDRLGNDIVGFQGNWRDIFQNWEALAWSFPLYNEAFIHKFLNASTADGYNPYRITAEGIDWEAPDPTDPWASIGYWGDHQIIYLLKLLEFSEKLDVQGLRRRLYQKDFVFAEVPYEIKDFAHLERAPNHSIHFNEDRNEAILARAETFGADGKLLHDASGCLVQANLLEKLLIPLAVKLSNYVPGGGIWMNTQRPEWNDANNALAGHGLSMVTTCYLHRYINFLDRMIPVESDDFECAEALVELIRGLDQALESSPAEAGRTPESRYGMVRQLGLAGERYRKATYAKTLGDRIKLRASEVKNLIAAARGHIRATIEANKRPDGLYHAYNILDIDAGRQTAEIKTLGPMLEGQVAILSSEAIDESQAFEVIEALRSSPLYCPRRNSYILYADKTLPTFLNYNRIEPSEAEAIPLLSNMLANEDPSLVVRSPDGCVRIQADIRNRFELEEALEQLRTDPNQADAVQADADAIHALYEKTFNHQSFTGRSGSMFAYEGLGSIYWHMVSKLMLAVQEWAIKACDTDTFDRFRSHYFEIQNGLGFRKSPKEYGAFPADAYSHTPAHAGAQQPGLTGMVKEGILCRFAELGIEIVDQTIRFNPRLLRDAEFVEKPVEYPVHLADGSTRTFTVPKNSLLFTFAQTPIIYMKSPTGRTQIEVELASGAPIQLDSDTLSKELSRDIFQRNHQIRSITVRLPNALRTT